MNNEKTKPIPSDEIKECLLKHNFNHREEIFRAMQAQCKYFNKLKPLSLDEPGKLFKED
ncbi:MAG: hypothetical protein ABIJ97_03140 [Bacteroidota bacterium]